MVSMNSNNWLSFPLSPTHSSLPLNLHSSQQAHHFSLGLVNDTMETPFQSQEWNLINSQGSSAAEVPKVADFLGVSKSENQSDLEAFNEIHQPNESDYFFPNNTHLLPVPNPVASAAGPAVAAAAASPNSYEFQENNNNLQSLTLSMGSGKGSTYETSGNNSSNSIVEAAPRRTLDTFGQRTSIYRGVTRHRWTGRYEAHLWDNSCRREGQSRKGRQVYLGGYDKEEKAARAYDLAALKYWGTSTTTNFPISNYERELEEMKHMTRQEFVASIRRKSSGFSRGASMYRGVTRHHQHGRWQARIGRVAGNKDLYLGTFSTEEEAAEAYDIAAIKFRGLNAVTNFDMNRYDVKSILESNTLPIGGGAAKRLKEAQAIESSRKREEMIALGSSFQYGSSSSSRLQNYPLMQHQQHQQQQQQQQQQQFDQQPPQPLLTFQHQEQQPLLTLQNPEISQYSQDSSHFHQNYVQTQLQLHQQSAEPSFLHHSSQNTTHLYNSYLHNNPAFLHGLMNMENNGSSSGSYNNGGGGGGGGGGGVGGVYFNNGVLGVASNSTTVANIGSAEELPLIKVDYDMPATAGYGGWGSGESVQGQNGGVFTMWND